MFPTTWNLQIRVHVYRPHHCCGDWLIFGCFVPMIADHNLVKKSFGPVILICHLILTKINCITLKIRSTADFKSKSQNIWQQIFMFSSTVMQMICAWHKIWTLSGRLLLIFLTMIIEEYVCFMSCEPILFCNYSYVVHTEYIYIYIYISSIEQCAWAIISPKEFKSWACM
jgi:hypothetical protein